MLSKPRAIQLDGRSVLRLDVSLILVDGIPNNENSFPIQRRSITYAAPPQYEVISNDDDEGINGDDDNDGDCIPLVDWQEFVFPTCNKLHENEILASGRYIDSGMNRDVWGLRDWGEEYIVLKTLAMRRPFTPHVIDLQRVDALISERSTASKYITNIYAYCGASAVNDFASEGSLDDVYKMLPRNERLHVATEVAHGLHDFHSLQDEKGRTAVIHSDIAVRQFLKINGRFQLNDFNTAKLIYQNSETGDLCPQYVGKAKDKNRSPEEMLQDHNEVTEMIDVFSMGNIFYKLLTNERKYNDLPLKVAQEKIKRKQLPPLNSYLEASNFGIHVALKNAIAMTLQRYPQERKSAKEVYEYLAKELSKHEENTRGTNFN